MACSVSTTITEALRKKGYIENDSNNIIGDTGKVFPYIDKLNKYARETYGATQDLVETFNVKNKAGNFTKIWLNL